MPQTVVSIGSTFVHFNPEIFPNPHQWRPERWLESPDLDDWLVTFSKGPRMCLGVKLVFPPPIPSPGKPSEAFETTC